MELRRRKCVVAIHKGQSGQNFASTHKLKIRSRKFSAGDGYVARTHMELGKRSTGGWEI